MNWSKKKFWILHEVIFSDEYNAYVMFLDDKIYKSKKGNILRIPSSFLAKKVKAEWDKIKDDFTSSKLQLTSIIEQLVDIDRRSRNSLSEELLDYVTTDLVRYRAPSPRELRSLQVEKWDPILSIYHKKFGIKLSTTVGLGQLDQDTGSIRNFKGLIGLCTDKRLFLIHKLCQILGSALLAVLLEKGQITDKKAWTLSHIEEDWQQRKWGIDQESLKIRNNKWKTFKLLTLCLRNF